MTYLSARDLLERSQPASQIARSGVDDEGDFRRRSAAKPEQSSSESCVVSCATTCCEAGGSGVSQKHEPRTKCHLLNPTSLPRVAITRGDATRDAQRHQMSSSRASLRSALVFEHSQPASQLARSRVNHTKSRRRSGDRDDDRHASALRIHSEGHNQREPPQRRPQRQRGDRSKTKNPVRSFLSGRGGGEKDDKFDVANVLAAIVMLRASDSSRAIVNLGSRRCFQASNSTSRRRSGGEPF
ncbi:MAG: hypothetical protein RL591_65 [Planctomycetota bacterium]